MINQAIRDAISEGIRKEDLRKLVYTSDVTTLLQDGLEKVIQGYTTFEELLKLIELEDDDTGEAMSLKRAIIDTNISHGEIGKKIQVVKRIIPNTANAATQPQVAPNPQTIVQPGVNQVPTQNVQTIRPVTPGQFEINNQQ